MRASLAAPGGLSFRTRTRSAGRDCRSSMEGGVCGARRNAPLAAQSDDQRERGQHDDRAHRRDRLRHTRLASAPNRRVVGERTVLLQNEPSAVVGQGAHPDSSPLPDDLSVRARVEFAASGSRSAATAARSQTSPRRTAGSGARRDDPVRAGELSAASRPAAAHEARPRQTLHAIRSPPTGCACRCSFLTARATTGRTRDVARGVPFVSGEMDG